MAWKIWTNWHLMWVYFILAGISGNESLIWIVEKSLTFRNNNAPLIIGWVHTHVNGNDCFLSSIDLHTQYAFECNSKESLAIVMKISESQEEETAFYQLSTYGKQAVKSCKEGLSFHESCRDDSYFVNKKHLIDTKHHNFTITDARGEYVKQFSLHNEFLFDLCRGCNQAKNSILQHIKHPMSLCRSSYLESEIQAMKDEMQSLKNKKRQRNYDSRKRSQKYLEKDKTKADERYQNQAEKISRKNKESYSKEERSNVYFEKQKEKAQERYQEQAEQISSQSKATYSQEKRSEKYFLKDKQKAQEKYQEQAEIIKNDKREAYSKEERSKIYFQKEKEKAQERYQEHSEEIGQRQKSTYTSE